MRKRTILMTAIMLAVGAVAGWLAASGRLTAALAQDKPMSQAAPPAATPSVLPRPDFHFPGSVGRTYLDSDPPQFPQPVQPPKGAPNVVLMLIDDVGFGQFSTFGGGVPSPTMDKLAAEGLRYNRFHMTALCSPTRATLITGRNHHSAAFASIAEAATVTLTVNGAKVAEGQLPKTIPLQISLGEGMDIGMDVGSPVDFTYKLPFPFTGKIEKVTIDLK
jgi:arylsulfatase